ncbi:MAG: NADP-dependent oxidoreductase, partial [Hyphomicrobiales bacterium]|nr:NADP-dependent oxidoreductase [Hyphomicrobiales bacterium]
ARTMAQMNDFGRIAICGLIASYEGAEKTTLPDMRIMLIRRLKMQGFIVSEFLSDWPTALSELVTLASTGKLKWRETVAEGVEKAPSAFLGMLKGKNFGKQLVKLF